MAKAKSGRCVKSKGRCFIIKKGTKIKGCKCTPKTPAYKKSKKSR